MKKRLIAILLAVLMMLSLFAGCGKDAGTTGDGTASAEMLYYLKEGENAILAAASTQESIAMLGNGFYSIDISSAKIYDPNGTEWTAENLTRGCPIRIEWDGSIAETYPAQVKATAVYQLSTTYNPAVPPEEEMTPLSAGGYWTVPQGDQIPGITIVHNDTGLELAKLASSFTTYDNEDYAYVGGPRMNSDPRDWYYENSKLAREANDTVTLVSPIDPSEIYIDAYSMTDDTVMPIYMNEAGEFSLLDGEFAYVITLVWNTSTCASTAIYAFVA